MEQTYGSQQGSFLMVVRRDDAKKEMNKNKDLKGHDKNLRQVEEVKRSDLKVFLDPAYYQIYIRSP
jgi:hypothetical protein